MTSIIKSSLFAVMIMVLIATVQAQEFARESIDREFQLLSRGNKGILRIEKRHNTCKKEGVGCHCPRGFPVGCTDSEGVTSSHFIFEQ
ncbi:hypothetical protein BGZ76_009715 [Entomortierella beljakovae]|nr:hypothetical protein BGZ76_009715 [Entomortierella beljakovae]